MTVRKIAVEGPHEKSAVVRNDDVGRTAGCMQQRKSREFRLSNSHVNHSFDEDSVGACGFDCAIYGNGHLQRFVD